MSTKMTLIDEPYKKAIAGQLLQGLFILLLILLMATFAWAENRVVRVGVYENAPKVFTSESGKPSGIFIDIIEYIAKQEDWDLEYVTGTWIEGLDRLDRGEIDLWPLRLNGTRNSLSIKSRCSPLGFRPMPAKTAGFGRYWT